MLLGNHKCKIAGNENDIARDRIVLTITRKKNSLMSQKGINPRSMIIRAMKAPKDVIIIEIYAKYMGKFNFKKKYVNGIVNNKMPPTII